ncbi:MAG: hypothetical protein K0R31_690 [Clostridiales bacterium]|jgi:hypothetical protein|nr:hypothetical protein [Clostridiales bacterium]
MEERNKEKNLVERLYNMNVLPIENLRGSDLPDVVMLNLHDKAEENTSDISTNSESTSEKSDS